MIPTDDSLFLVMYTVSMQAKRCKSYVEALARNIILITVRLIRSKEIPSKVGFRLADKTKKISVKALEKLINQATTISPHHQTQPLIYCLWFVPHCMTF
jgi:hypothetical protein